MNVTYDSSVDFITAHSLFAALESQCLEAGAAETLPYLGMARSEFTDYGQHVPTGLHEAHFGSFEGGLRQLDQMLTSLIEASTSLPDTLRLTRARDVLREGTNLG
jgi:hypothetical protein